MSFNYPVKPTNKDKKEYRNFVISLKYVLPCKYCRDNFTNNLKELPLTMNRMKNRETFSLYIYELHEVINKMLNKSSNLSYNDIRNRYEHFRSRCIISPNKKLKLTKKTKRNKKENGCTKPLYGKKAKCVINIIPQNKKPTEDSIKVDKDCILKK